MPKIGLFLGAGASKPFGLPTVSEYFGRVGWNKPGRGGGVRARGCESAAKEFARRVWVSRGQEGTAPFPDFNSEWFFEDLQKVVDTTSLKNGNNLTGNTWTIREATPEQLLKFLKREAIYIFSKPNKDPSTEYSTLIEGLKKEIGIEGPLKIFTTNYDSIIEEFCRR